MSVTEIIRIIKPRELGGAQRMAQLSGGRGGRAVGGAGRGGSRKEGEGFQTLG